MAELKSRNEKEYERALCERIDRYLADPKINDPIPFARTTSDAKSLGDLIGLTAVKVLPDNSEWRQNHDVLVDLTGGMTPDIVLRSNLSGQNRILIEVKCESRLNYGRVDSQIVRYFLHLLATTLHDAKNKFEVRRAVVLAAPRAWFEVPQNRADLEYFNSTYGPIASVFGITLAEIDLPSLKELGAPC